MSEYAVCFKRVLWVCFMTSPDRFVMTTVRQMLVLESMLVGGCVLNEMPAQWSPPCLISGGASLAVKFTPSFSSLPETYFCNNLQ